MKKTFTWIADNINTQAFTNLYDSLLFVIDFIVSRTSDSLAGILIKALPLLAPVPNAVSVWRISQQAPLHYDTLQAGALAEINRLRELVYLAHDTDCTCEICVAMPHEPIICCICNKPIEGDDLDNRFWLHEKGCQFGHTGLCECDLECHAACYAGHEHEYAPPFDDEDDE